MEVSDGFQLIGTLPDWLGLVIAVLGLFAAPITGSYVAARSRMRLEDRRRIYDSYLDDLKVRHRKLDMRMVDLRHLSGVSDDRAVQQIDAFRQAERSITRTVKLLPWTDRQLWRNLIHEIDSHPEWTGMEKFPELQGSRRFRLIGTQKTSHELLATRIDLSLMCESDGYREAHEDLESYLRRAIAPRRFDKLRNIPLRVRLYRKTFLQWVKSNSLLSGIIGVAVLLSVLRLIQWLNSLF